MYEHNRFIYCDDCADYLDDSEEVPTEISDQVDKVTYCHHCGSLINAALTESALDDIYEMILEYLRKPNRKLWEQLREILAVYSLELSDMGRGLYDLLADYESRVSG